MLRIDIPSTEMWDEEKQEFISIKGMTLQLEHSLVSVSKWESKWNKPFVGNKNITLEESIDYIKCMTITQNVKPEVYACLTDEHMDEINKYIEAPMTATTFSDRKQGGGKEVITSEVIYYQMIGLNIPFECQKWHLNRLLTLIKVCSIKNGPQKKMSKRETASHYAALNAARRKKMKTRG